MPIEILMPALSPTMEEGNLTKWLVKEGDKVVAGDVIAEIETDKATMEVEVIDEGVVARLVVAEGSQGVKVNGLIAVLAEDGEDVKVAATHKVFNASSVQSLKDSVKENTAISDVSSADFSEEIDAKVKPEDAIKEYLLNPEISPDAEMVSITVRQALRDAMIEEMRADDSVFVMGEEVAEYEGAYKITQGLLEEFGPRRVVDTPITEHGFAGLGVGAAMGGLRPIVEFMTFNFAMQAMDQLINSAARTLYMSGGQMNVPIVFRGPNGAAARVAAQHSQCFATWFGHIPGLKVIAPYCASDAKGLLKAAIRDPNPVIFLENEILYGHVFDVPDQQDFVLPIGKARVHRTGNDATIVSFGFGMTYAVEAAAQLVEEGIDCEIIDLRTIRPLDMETILESVRKTGRLVTVEEGFPQSSIGGHIASQVMQQAFDWLDAPVITICGKDVPMPYAANLEKLALPCVEDVIEAVKAVGYRN